MLARHNNGQAGNNDYRLMNTQKRQWRKRQVDRYLMEVYWYLLFAEIDLRLIWHSTISNFSTN